jgi:hypothetical protein
VSIQDTAQAARGARYRAKLPRSSHDSLLHRRRPSGHAGQFSRVVLHRPWMLLARGPAISPFALPGKAKTESRHRESLRCLPVPHRLRQPGCCPPRFLKIGSALRFEWLAWIKAASKAAACKKHQTNSYQKQLWLQPVRGSRKASFFLQ